MVVSIQLRWLSIESYRGGGGVAKIVVKFILPVTKKNTKNVAHILGGISFPNKKPMCLCLFQTGAFHHGRKLDTGHGGQGVENSWERL